MSDFCASPPATSAAVDDPDQRLLAGLFRIKDLARVYDPLPIDVLLMDQHRQVLWYNRVMRQRLGVTLDGQRPRYCYEVMHGISSPPSQCMAELFRNGNGRGLPLATREEGGRQITLVPLWHDGEADPAAYLCLGFPRLQSPGCDATLSSEEMRAIAAQTGDAIFLMDLDGRLVFWNPAAERMFGLTIDKSLGNLLGDLVVSPDSCEEYRRALALFNRENRGLVQDKLLEIDGLRPDGSRFPLELTFSLLQVGEQQRVLVFARDITMRKRREEEETRLRSKLQQAQKLESLGVLAGGIAHDFNNLLMGVLGYADLAQLQLPLESPAREYLRQIEIAARRAAELTSQMLAYSGRARFMVEGLNLSRLVEEMAHLLKTVVTRNAVLKLSLTSELPLVEVDSSQVRQVVLNLVTNASDAIEEKSGVITITTGVMEVDSDYLSETYLDDDLTPGYYSYLEVSDTGCGMDRQTRSCLFDPFFTTKFTGRGLGMAAVLGIVRGHRGAIKVYSESGHGTTVKVLFPCTAPPSAPGGAAVAVRDSAKSKAVILVVDDEETVRAVSKMMLEHMGHRVLTAGDGREGLELFREHSVEIDMVLLDMTMPHLNGEECYRELRRVRPDVRVLLTSGYNEQEAIARFAGKGLAGFVQKPFSMSELRGAVDRVLAGGEG